MSFEDDLRDSLNQAGDAIGAPGAPLEEIRSRGRRRKAWKAAGTALVTVIVVGVGTLGMATVFGGSDGSPVAESTVVTTQAPITTGPPPTESVVTPTETSIPPSVNYPVPFLVEAEDRVLTVATDGTERVVYAGRYHRVASDGAGGLVFQAEIAIEDQSRHRATIYRVAGGMTEPVSLVEQDPGHIIEMFGVEDVDGIATLLYTDRTGYASSETAQTVLVALDLESGMARQLAIVGGWESGIRSVSYGGGTYLLESMAESEVWWRYLDENGNEIEPAFDTHPGCQISDDVRCPTQPLIAPEGDVLFVRHRYFTPDYEEIDLSAADFVVVNDQGLALFAGDSETVIGDFVEITELVVFDLSNGREQVLYSVPTEERAPGQDGATSLDFDHDGRYYIVALYPTADPASPTMAIIDSQPPFPVVTIDRVGIPRFPLAPFDLPSVITSPFG